MAATRPRDVPARGVFCHQQGAAIDLQAVYPPKRRDDSLARRSPGLPGRTRERAPAGRSLRTGIAGGQTRREHPPEQLLPAAPLPCTSGGGGHRQRSDHGSQVPMWATPPAPELRAVPRSTSRRTIGPRPWRETPDMSAQVWLPLPFGPEAAAGWQGTPEVCAHIGRPLQSRLRLRRPSGMPPGQTPGRLGPSPTARPPGRPRRAPAATPPAVQGSAPPADSQIV